MHTWFQFHELILKLFRVFANTAFVSHFEREKVTLKFKTAMLLKDKVLFTMAITLENFKCGFLHCVKKYDNKLEAQN